MAPFRVSSSARISLAPLGAWQENFQVLDAHLFCRGFDDFLGHVFSRLDIDLEMERAHFGGCRGADGCDPRAPMSRASW